MRRSARRSALLSSVLLVATLTSVPARAGGPDDVVGGPQLGSRGVVVAPGSPALPPALTAASWVLADLDTGAVLAAKDPHGRYAPASTLKMLTALAVMPHLDVDHKVVPTFDDINVEGSRVGLVQRVGYPVHELLTSLLVVSANDSANVLATAAGGLPATLRLMHETAASLGAHDTRAVNPSGLDAKGQVSSAYDLALIARAGMRIPEFVGYVTTRTSSVSAPGRARIEIYAHNKLLRNYEGALGIKNGYTAKARASFVGAAARGDRRLVVTLMRAEPRVWKEAAALLDWGFALGDAQPSVGTLVEPTPPPAEDADSVGSTAHYALARDEASTTESRPVTPASVGALLLAVAALEIVRRRRRRSSLAF
ncbi:MAG TPA: serine hydrolase [Mycobacteriales bacterium]|nr:serine hydrolase [Mycobacteriales bacterium]